MCLVVKGLEHFSFRFWPFVLRCLKMDVHFICSFANEDIYLLIGICSFFNVLILNFLSILGIYFSSWGVEILSNFFHSELISPLFAFLSINTYYLPYCYDSVYEFDLIVVFICSSAARDVIQNLFMWQVTIFISSL